MSVLPFRSESGWLPTGQGGCYDEVPWHVTHPDPEYGVAGAGSAHNFPQVGKMPLFTSVPSVAAGGGGGSSGPKSGQSSESPDEAGGPPPPPTNRYFSLRQPHNLTGVFSPKVALHEGPPSGADPDHNHNQPLPTVFQPTSLMPDWR